jgi:hypothetical protein
MRMGAGFEWAIIRADSRWQAREVKHLMSDPAHPKRPDVVAALNPV